MSDNPLAFHIRFLSSLRSRLKLLHPSPNCTLREENIVHVHFKEEIGIAELIPLVTTYIILFAYIYFSTRRFVGWRAKRVEQAKNPPVYIYIYLPAKGWVVGHNFPGYIWEKRVPSTALQFSCFSSKGDVEILSLWYLLRCSLSYTALNAVVVMLFPMWTDQFVIMQIKYTF